MFTLLEITNLVFIFESDFIYTENNFNNLKLLSNLFNKLEANIVYEFHDTSWFNNTVVEYLIDNNITIATLIINNNNDYGYNLINNLDDIQQYNFPINYIKLYGSINKFNGSHSNDLLLLIDYIMNNNKSDNVNESNIKKLIDLNKSHFIYFNNIETDLNNKRYKNSINELDINKNEDSFNENTDENSKEKLTPINNKKISSDSDNESDSSIIIDSNIEESLTDNINIPSAVFDAKCLYKLLEKLNNLKK